MLHLWFIAVVGVLFLRDGLGSRPLAAAFLDDSLLRIVAFLSPLPMLVVLAGVFVATRMCLRWFDRGRPVAASVSHAVVEIGQGAAVLVHIIAVLVFGWLDAVRSVMGDVILLDELVALVPVLATIVLTWACGYDIDRRCREAILLRHLDEGRVVALPTRPQFVLSHVRHHATIVLVPILLIVGWAEMTQRLLMWLHDRIGEPGFLGRVAELVATSDRISISAAVLQLSGVLAVFTVTPALLRVLWDTTSLGPGPLRDRLEAICHMNRVKIRDLLVWRTHGWMINGAVVGLLAPLRYILLTDALLESLPSNQVEAVMAHEVAHVRHRHMPWLAGVLLVTVIGSASGIAVLVGPIEHLAPVLASATDVLITLAAFGLGMLALGAVSRRFEWQADAFAAQTLTRADSSHRVADPIDPEAVAAMSGALHAVARLNNVPMHRPSWRHGSIATRRTRLHALAGVDAERVPIDATVRRIKLAVVAGVVVLIAGVVLW